mmetsp:Transcript_82559/g.229052  ORF Transcript_82559/g.229052 Transcript_82559/m.229052 type:complete len:380 (-) Transcript_82559:121-1260(-)
MPARKCDRTVRAHSNWSMKKGWHTMGTPQARASMVLFMPQWDRKQRTRSQRRTSFWFTKCSTRHRSLGSPSGSQTCKSFGSAQSTRQEPPSSASASRCTMPLKPFTMVPKATYTTGSAESSEKSQSSRSASRHICKASLPTCTFPPMGSGNGRRGQQKSSFPSGCDSTIQFELGKIWMGSKAGFSLTRISPIRISIGNPKPGIWKSGRHSGVILSMSNFPPLAMKSSTVGGAPINMSFPLKTSSPPAGSPSITAGALGSDLVTLEAATSSGGRKMSPGTKRSSLMPGELMNRVRAPPNRPPNLFKFAMENAESDTMIDGLTLIRTRMRKQQSLGVFAFSTLFGSVLVPFSSIGSTFCLSSALPAPLFWSFTIEASRISS